MNRTLPLLALCASFFLAGCGQKKAGPMEWAVQVKTAKAVVEPVEERITLVATLSANEVVDIQSEMDGAVKSINFNEGQPVAKGQLLFELDTGKLEASVAESAVQTIVLRHEALGTAHDVVPLPAARARATIPATASAGVTGVSAKTSPVAGSRAGRDGDRDGR